MMYKEKIIKHTLAHSYDAYALIIPEEKYFYFILFIFRDIQQKKNKALASRALFQSKFILSLGQFCLSVVNNFGLLLTIFIIYQINLRDTP